MLYFEVGVDHSTVSVSNVYTLVPQYLRDRRFKIVAFACHPMQIPLGNIDKIKVLTIHRLVLEEPIHEPSQALPMKLYLWLSCEVISLMILWNYFAAGEIMGTFFLCLICTLSPVTTTENTDENFPDQIAQVSAFYFIHCSLLNFNRSKCFDLEICLRRDVMVCFTTN